MSAVVATYTRLSGPEGRALLSRVVARFHDTLRPAIPKGFQLTWYYGAKARGGPSEFVPSSRTRDLEVYEVIRSTDLHTLTLSNGPWKIGFNMEPWDEGPSVLAFDVDARCFSPDGVLNSLWQSRLVELVKWSVAEVSACSAYITREATPQSFYATPFESLWRLTYPAYRRKMDRYARGYFWGNVLNPNLIASLGGIDNISSKGFVVCEAFPTERGPWLYLQVSRSLNSFTDDNLRKLRSVLSPVLPAGYLASNLLPHFSKSHRLLLQDEKRIAEERKGLVPPLMLEEVESDHTTDQEWFGAAIALQHMYEIDPVTAARYIPKYIEHFRICRQEAGKELDDSMPRFFSLMLMDEPDAVAKFMRLTVAMPEVDKEFLLDQWLKEPAAVFSSEVRESLVSTAVSIWGLKARRK